MIRKYIQLFSTYTLLCLSTFIAAEPKNYQIEVWADNWFSAYLDGEPLLQDSVSINTERSFNAETTKFVATRPFVLAFIIKDFKQNDSGLEYIGSRRQQMGDGGFISQVTDLGTGEVIGVSNAEMRCTVIHKAPLDRTCVSLPSPIAGQGACQFTRFAEPKLWISPSFDDSSWPFATEYSQAQVRPKGGFDNITWDKNAKLIWSEDLETDNTLLCRMLVEEQPAKQKNTGNAHNHFAKFANVHTREVANHLHISSTGIPEHNMMVGITNWQQQVPLPQGYSGNNSWIIPLHPVLAAKPLLTKDHLHRGAIAIAVNGVPIFNAFNNRGEYAADIGELDTWGGHSGKADDYHYHLAPEHLESTVGKGNPIAYVLDGFPLYAKTTAKLDKYLGRFNQSGSYQYHAADYPPYLIAGIRGVVKTDAITNAPEDQIEPQPRSTPVRSGDYRPLPGARIVEFSKTAETSYTLKYQIGQNSHSINYSWDNNGQYQFIYIDGQGNRTVETHSLNAERAQVHNNSKTAHPSRPATAANKPRKYCGDNICDHTENTNSCAADC